VFVFQQVRCSFCNRLSEKRSCARVVLEKRADFSADHRIIWRGLFEPPHEVRRLMLECRLEQVAGAPMLFWSHRLTELKACATAAAHAAQVVQGFSPVEGVIG
jgi:hypothetical protein